MKASVKAKSVAERDRDTEQRILDAAHAVFVRRGTAGARMQEIAEEAGVNKALLHYYFRNKSRLAEAVFRRVGQGLFARLAATLAGPGDIEEKVRAVIALYIEQLSATPYAPGYVIGEVSQHPERARQLLDALQRGREDAGLGPPAFLSALDAQIRERVRAGQMRPISTQQFVSNLVSLSVFPFAARPILSAVFSLDDRGFQRFIDERKRTLPEFFLAGLRP